MVRNYKGLVLHTVAASREYPPQRELPVETDAGMISCTSDMKGRPDCAVPTQSNYFVTNGSGVKIQCKPTNS
jgi:hypothetical protein